MRDRGTAAIPDELVAVARLACGHARVVFGNVGVIAPGWRTHCFECEATVEADHPVHPQPVEAIRLVRALVEIGPQRFGREGRCAVCGVWRSRGSHAVDCPWAQAEQWLAANAPAPV